MASARILLAVLTVIQFTSHRWAPLCHDPTMHCRSSKKTDDRDFITGGPAQDLVNAASKNTLRGQRDGAILGLLLGFGLRRSEVVGLNLDQLQTREGRWIIANLARKPSRLMYVIDEDGKEHGRLVFHETEIPIRNVRVVTQSRPSPSPTVLNTAGNSVSPMRIGEGDYNRWRGAEPIPRSTTENKKSRPFPGGSWWESVTARSGMCARPPRSWPTRR
jgi:integrase